MTDTSLTISSDNTAAFQRIHSALAAAAGLDYDRLCVEVLDRLKPASRRVQAVALKKWAAWCAEAGISPLAMTVGNVQAYLAETGNAHATQQREVTILRKVLDRAYSVAGLLAPEALPVLQYMREDLRTWTPSRAEANDAGEREGRALNRAEVARLLNLYADLDTDAARRDRAMIALLFATGLRRAEVVALKWADLDLDACTVTVAHGKGDKRRVVPVLSAAALDRLHVLKAHAPQQAGFVFLSVKRGGAYHAEPRGLTGTDVYRTLKTAQDAAGLTSFTPHDARRTVITSLLRAGMPLADVQQVAGHAQGSTTLHYAQATDAEALVQQYALPW